jgi:Uma2 family endonuclease
MAMPSPSVHPRRRYTLEEFERIRDAASPGPRYEYVDGEILVTPSPDSVHQRLVVLLAILLDPFVRANGVGQLLVAPFDVRFGGHRVFQPDLLVRPASEVASGRRDSAGELRLAVEIMSPSSSRSDRRDKRPRYQEERVEELWLVDPESELVERWRPDDERPEIVAENLAWQPAVCDAELTIDLPRLFAEAKQ